MKRGSTREPKTGTFEAVIFDIDGTIWDIFPVYYQSVNECLIKHGIPSLEFDFLIGLLKAGEPFNKKLASLKESLNLKVTIDDLIDEIRHIFSDLEERTVQPYPGVTSLFSQLKNKNIKIGMATGRFTPCERIRKICRRMEIEHFVDAVTSQLYVQNRKPAPDLIIDCAQLLEISVKKCLVVGDTKDDILAGKKAGAAAIGILSGIDNYKEMMALQPLAVVKNPEDILDFV
jgi:HAD superfamily hydrolase (TIGR01509 family)